MLGGHLPTPDTSARIRHYEVDDQNLKTVPVRRLTLPFVEPVTHRSAETEPLMAAAAPELFVTVPFRKNSDDPVGQRFVLPPWPLRRKVVVPPFFQFTVSMPWEPPNMPDPPVVELVHPVRWAVGLANLPERALQVVPVAAPAGVVSARVPGRVNRKITSKRMGTLGKATLLPVVVPPPVG